MMATRPSTPLDQRISTTEKPDLAVVAMPSNPDRPPVEFYPVTVDQAEPPVNTVAYDAGRVLAVAAERWGLRIVGGHARVTHFDLTGHAAAPVGGA